MLRNTALFTDPTADRYLDQPEFIFDPVWPLPDLTLHSLNDAENTGRLAV
jgi:hypothetical protein